MVEHKKIYYNYYGLQAEGDFKKCEIPWCGKKHEEVHHITARGMGGTSDKDTINNLMGLCQGHHKKFGDKTFWNERLKFIHLHDMIKHTRLQRYENY
jgi:hypothetical protein